MSDSYNARRAGLGIAFVSGSMLMTEILLTRLFSVTIGFHFAFLAISVALFGIGTAALVVHLAQRHLPEHKTGALLTAGSVALAVAIVGADLFFVLVPPAFQGGRTGIVSQATSVPYLIEAFLVTSAPFFAGGFVVSLAITRYARRIHSLYFFDLLGAGAGCLLVIPASSLFGAPVALLFTAAIAAGSGLIFGRERDARPAAWAVPAAFLVALLALALAAPATGLLEIRRAKGRDLTRLPVDFNRWNSFSMVTVLDDKRRSARQFPGWGLSRRYQGKFPEQKTLLIDMGAMTPLTRFNGDLGKLDHLAHDLSAFAYHLRPDGGGDVCVLGAGGGRDVLTALAAKARHVTGVEINPLIVDDVVRGEFREFAGGLYHRPDVTAVVGDGRAFIRSSEKKFDVIQISIIDTSAATAAGAYSLTESGLYTAEAFDDYLAHLKPEGLLTVSAVSAPIVDSGARLSTMAWVALRKLGSDPARSVAVTSTSWLGRKHHTMRNLVVKKEPFSAEEIALLETTAEGLDFEATFVPGRPARSGQLIGEILTAKDERALENAISGYHLDVSPTSDDRPFFFYQNRLSDVAKILGLGGGGGKPRKMGTGLQVLVRVAMVALVSVIVFLLVPLIFARRRLGTGGGNPVWDLAYVSLLGLGFMYVEIGLLQHFTLYLGSPTATLAAVLLVVLGAGAVGSRLFGRLAPEKRRSRLVAAIAALAALLVIVWQSGLAGEITTATCGWPLAGRAALAAVMLAPAGLLLGMPLPAGLFAVASRADHRIPWLWAINSATSVLGSVSATLFSMHAGISSTIWVGVGLYLLAMLVSLRVNAGLGQQ